MPKTGHRRTLWAIAREKVESNKRLKAVRLQIRLDYEKRRPKIGDLLDSLCELRLPAEAASAIERVAVFAKRRAKAVVDSHLSFLGALNKYLGAPNVATEISKAINEEFLELAESPDGVNEILAKVEPRISAKLRNRYERLKQEAMLEGRNHVDERGNLRTNNFSPGFDHDDEFTWYMWNGRRYNLKGKRKIAFELLHDDFVKGAKGIHQDRILQEVESLFGSLPDSVQNLFKDHPPFGKLIIRTAPATWTLRPLTVCLCVRR